MTNPPRLHVFGHIHEARGALIHKWNPDPNFWSSLDSSGLDSSPSGSGEEGPNSASSQNDCEGWKESIMVNAANQPAGQRRTLNGVRVPFGGPGFQPIIVDLLNQP
jgi:hypothetical protein